MAYDYSDIDNLYNTGLFEFASIFNVNEADLNATASGSGVHLNKNVTIDLNILDRQSGDIDSATDLLSNSYVNNINVDILDITGGTVYPSFLSGYKSNTFSFTEYDNINVFGDYAKHFGIKATVVDRDLSEHVSEFYFYGNNPVISGITIQDSTGTTSHSESKGAKSAVNANGQTGALTATVTFLNNINYVAFDRLEMYSSTTSAEFDPAVNTQAVFARNLTNEGTQSFDIKEGILPNGEDVYLHFLPYGRIDSGEAWTVGPYRFEDNPLATNQYITKDDTGEFLTSGDLEDYLTGEAQSLQDVTTIGSGTTNNITFSGSVYGTGDGNRITTNGVPYLLASSNETTPTLQSVTDNGATTTNLVKLRPANGAGLSINDAVYFQGSSAEGGSLTLESNKFIFNVSGSSDENSAESNEVNSFGSTIVLGTRNKIFGDYDGIVAGTTNIISGSGSNTANYGFVGAGSGMLISESDFSSIVGGADNTIQRQSHYSFIGGGTGNTLDASAYSVIGGGVNNYIQSSEAVQVFGSYISGNTEHNGYIYLSDNDNRTKTPTRSDALFIDFTGGVDIKTGDLTVVNDVSISGDITSVDSVQFDTGAGTTVGQAQLAWNSQDLTLDLGLDSNVTLQVGQEQLIRVKCVDPSGVYDGMAVYAAGTIGASDNIEIERFTASYTGVDELYFVGVATEDMAENAVGFVTTFGKVREVDGRAFGTGQGVKDPADTGDWALGDILWVSPNQAGTLTTIKPSAPNRRMAVAMVLAAPNQQNITLMVRAEHGYHLDEIHDIRYNSQADRDLLLWNASDEVWENGTLTSGDITGALGFTPSSTDDQTLNEVLTQGNVSASGITVGSSTISGDLDVSGALTVTNDDTGVSDIFSVDGVNGRLFGVTDEVTGTVFSVNDAAGLPIVEVESTSGYDKITIGEYGSDALVISGTNSAIFNVDVDITGGLDVTGDITMAGNTVLTGITSADVTTALGYTPVSSETDSQDLDSVLGYGNSSELGISVGDISGSGVFNLKGSTSSELDISTSAFGAVINPKGGSYNILYLNSSAGDVRLAQSSVNNKLSLWNSSAQNKVLLNSNGNSYFDGGNVGIGTTSPSDKLDVFGDLRVSYDASNYFTIEPLSNGNAYFKASGGSLHFAQTAKNNQIFLYDYTSASTRWGEYDASSIKLKTSSNAIGILLDVDGNSYINTGNVGIGTNNPTYKLQVHGNVNVVGTGGYIRWNSGDVAIKNEGSYKLGFQTYNTTSASLTTKMVLDTDGNVGIGTNNPAAKLQIDTSTSNGDGEGIRLNRPSAGTHYHALELATNGTVDWSVGQNSNDAFEVYENGAAATTRLTIKEGGNVGIGTTSPSSLLSIQGQETHTTGTISYTDALLDIYNDWESNTDEKGAILTFSDNYFDGSNYHKTTRAAIKGGTDTVGNTANGFLAFYTDSTAANTANERMRIDNDGNVGIGRTDPSTRLDVKGSDGKVPILKLSDGSANGYTLLGDHYTSTSNILSLGLSYSGANAVFSRSVKVSDTANDTYLSSQASFAAKPNAFVLHQDGSFRFLNTNTSATTAVDTAVTLTERMRITSAGNVGIGVSSDPSNKLEVNGNIAVKTASGNSGIKIITDNSSEAFLIMGDPDDNSMGGLAYNNSTNTLSIDCNNQERMTILSDGNVGIGNTNPTAAKLVIRKDDGYALRTENASGWTFRVAGATGNTEVGGTISVEGAVTLNTVVASSESDALFINGSNVVVKRTLGTNAFTSTAYAPIANPTFTGTVTAPNLTLTNIASSSETNALFINASNGVFKRTLGSAAFSATSDFLGATAKAADSDKLDNLDSTQFLRSDADDETTGNLNIQSSDGSKSLRVGDITNDDYVQLSQDTSSSTVRGFTNQYSNASILENLQGSTNQHIVLGDVDNGNANTLFGVSVTQSGTTYPKLTLSGAGDVTFAGSVKTEGPDGGMVMRAWTNDSNYGMIGTANMSGSEYALLTNGTNTYISAGSSGIVYIRGGNNNSSPQLKVSTTNIELTGLSNKTSEATALVIDDSDNVGYRELGSNAFNSTSYLPLSGGTLTGDVIFDDGSGDSPALKFRDGSDINFSIYHSSSNTLLITREGNSGADFAIHANATDYTNSYISIGGSQVTPTLISNWSTAYTHTSATNNPHSVTKSQVGLANVENTALSTWAGSANITTLGTIGTGTWQGSVIASAYLDADTAHLSGTQTFTGTKTFNDISSAYGYKANIAESSDADNITSNNVKYGYLSNAATNKPVSGNSQYASVGNITLTHYDTNTNDDFYIRAKAYNGNTSWAKIFTNQNSSGITTVGTITSGEWNGSVIASAYLDADTAHLSGTQTFSGTKIFEQSGTNALALKISDGTSFLQFVPNLGSGGYTQMASAGDIGLIFSTDDSNSSEDTGKGLVIAPWSDGGGLKIDDAGNVGIGTTSPAVDLHVADDVRIDDQLYVRTISSQYFSSSNNLSLIYGGAANFTVSSNATERFRIDSSGDVGIGTTSPDTKLTIQQAADENGVKIIGFDDQSSENFQIFVRSSGHARMIGTNAVFLLSGDNYGGAVRSGASGGMDWDAFNQFTFSAESNARTPLSIQGAASQTGNLFNITSSGGTDGDLLTVLNNGRVGIGVIAPDSNLQVASTVKIGSSSESSYSLRLERQNATITQDAHFFCSSNNSPKALFIEGGYWTGEEAGTVTAANSGYAYYESYFGNGSNSTYKDFGFVESTGSFSSVDLASSIRLFSSGNVCIGATTPTTTGGTAKLTINVGATTNVPVTIANGTSDSLYIRRYGASQYQLQTTSGANNTGDLSLQSYGGSVGIGEINPTHKLEVSDSGNAISGDNVDISELTLKLRKDNDSNDQGVGLGFSASTTDSNIGAAIVHKRKGSDSYGELHFATKPSGASAGSDIPIRMTIDSSGSVGIGTTSPDYELHVIGTASFTDTVAGAYFEENASHPSLKKLDTGTILVMNEEGQLVPCSKADDTMVFGVSKHGYKQPIVMGAEPIKVTGPIKVGDYITTSDIPGHGKKSNQPYPFGTIIAQAMESGDGESYNIKAMIRKM